jgi:hypothetical protein
MWASNQDRAVRFAKSAREVPSGLRRSAFTRRKKGKKPLRQLNPKNESILTGISSPVFAEKAKAS